MTRPQARVMWADPDAPHQITIDAIPGTDRLAVGCTCGAPAEPIRADAPIRSEQAIWRHALAHDLGRGPLPESLPDRASSLTCH